MAWRKETREGYKAFQKDLHESEQVFWQGISEIYHLGWIKTAQVKKVYFERVGWYGACCRFRVAMAQLANDQVVLMAIGGGQGDYFSWSPFRIEIWDKEPPQKLDDFRRGEGTWFLMRTSSDPIIWTRMNKSDGVPVLDQVESFVGVRRGKKIKKLFESWLDPKWSKPLGLNSMS